MAQSTTAAGAAPMPSEPTGTDVPDGPLPSRQRTGMVSHLLGSGLVRRVLVVAAAVVAAACSSASPAERVLAAPARTVAEGTARVWQRVEVTPADGVAGGPGPVVATAEGVVDFDAAEGALTVTAGGEELEVVFQGATIYQRLPDAAAAAAGRDWVRIDLDAVGEAVGVEGLAELVRSRSSDPSAALQYLRGAAGSVRTVGDEPIRGVRTTWYETTIDVGRAAGGAPAGVARTIRQIEEVFGVSRIPTDVWIDGDGRARRLRQEIDYSAAGGSGRFPPGALPQRVDLTVELYDFGVPVSVRAPPADEVADYADVAGRARRGEGPGAASPATDALVARLLVELPPGYERQPDDVGDTGPSDLDKAVRDDGAPDARQVLEADGFVAGYQRMWAKDQEGLIVDFVYQFSSPAGAVHYRDRTLQSLAGEPGATELAVPGVPGATGVRIVEDDEHTAVVFVTRGGLLGQVVVVGPDAGTDAVPVALARQQYDRFG